jgi:hydrogenase-4 membrane subunit HyfE
MNRSFLILILSASGYFSNASSALPSRLDTIPVSKAAYKLSKTEFLEVYGKDGTARALIHFHFSKRSRALALVIIGLPELIASSLLYNSVLMGAAGQGLGALIIASAYLGITVDLGLAFSIVGFVKGLIYSRRKLLSQIRGYYAGKGIPARIAKSRQFKKRLLFENKSHG